MDLAVGSNMQFLEREEYHIPAMGEFDPKKIKIDHLQIKTMLVPTRGGISTQTILFACKIAKAFGAKITVLHVVEVSFFMPINTSVLQRETFSEEVLKRAAAIGKDLGVEMELKTVRSRSVYKTICKEIVDGKYDALVLGASQEPNAGLGKLTEKLLKTVPCYVFVCRHNLEPTPESYDYLFGLKN